MSLEIKERLSLKPFNWWKVGGEAEFCCFPKNLEDLQQACEFSKKKNILIHILSGGTNTLVSDELIRGLVIVLSDLNSIKVDVKEDKIKVECLAGASKSELLKICSQYKLEASFFLCGLPGDIGAGVVMNAGIGRSDYSKEFKDIVHSIEVLNFSDLKLHSFRKEDLEWGYRYCKGYGEGIIYKVYFEFKNSSVDNFSSILKSFHKQRASTQPLNKPSCGSVFKNPHGDKSGRIIEELGLKGYRMGGAQVSTKHANFILNTDNAKATDIYQLICHIQKEVKEKKGIFLEPEVRYLGLFK